MEQKDRFALIESMLASEDMAQGAYKYQGWIINEALEWLDRNGYEIRRKDSLVLNS